MVFLPLSVVAYAWLAQEHVHVASLCVTLFFIGFCSMSTRYFFFFFCLFLTTKPFYYRWIYSSVFAYIVDSNPGRSSAAVATNSCFRGVVAFVFTEAAVPLQNSMGDGGLYTLWAGILVLCELLLLLVRSRGGVWREAAVECERPQANSLSSESTPGHERATGK